MKNNNSGFTLIELMIAMFIMSMVTILVSASVRTSVQNKKKLEARVASETLLYDSLRVIRLDLEKAFNYQDFFYQMEVAAIQRNNRSSANPNQIGRSNTVGRASFPGLSPSGNSGSSNIQVPPPPIRLTHFLGEESSMHFTSLNHYRTKYDAQESNQAEVGYFLDSCQRRSGSKKGSTRCLWRRSSPSIDDKVDEGGTRVVVAEAISKFELSYRSDRENDQWVKQWRSDSRGRGDHRDKFPTFVKVELALGEADNPQLRPVQMSMIVRIPFTNNEPLNLSNTAQSATTSTGSSN